MLEKKKTKYTILYNAIVTATNITANLADHFSVRLKDDKLKHHVRPPLRATCLSIPFRTANDSMFAVYAAIISQWIEYDNDLVFTLNGLSMIMI